MRRTSSGQLEVAPGVWLDARRAVWLAPERVLAVADLHLGYPWVQRRAGQLLPIGAPDDTLERLMALMESYSPERVVLLGDIVHRACLDLPQLGAELRNFLTTLGSSCRVQLVGGNHDRNLEKLLNFLRLDCLVESQVSAGPHLLLHGDTEPDEEQTVSRRSDSGFIVMGHEHPAVRLGDGVASSARCPCFLIGPRLLVVPAFSNWTSGTVTSHYEPMSPLARTERFTRAIVIVAGKLLALPFPLGC
ncbi:MAG: metallophosphoesterase [Verrucomicrobiia bacterium]